jgi:hypothetical protein
LNKGFYTGDTNVPGFFLCCHTRSNLVMDQQQPAVAPAAAADAPHRGLAAGQIDALLE